MLAATTPHGEETREATHRRSDCRDTRLADGHRGLRSSRRCLPCEGTPLAHPCTVGDVCRAFSGPNPGQPTKVILAVFIDGPILIETASQVPSAQFDAIEPQIETSVYGLLAAADGQVRTALGENTHTNTPTATPTETLVPPTATPTATPKPHKKKCKKGSKLVHGKCKKKKKH